MTNVPPPGYGGYTRKPPPEGDGTPPPKKKRYWWRFSLAGLIIVAVTAAATSSAILLYIDSIAEAIGTKENKHLSKEVESVIAKVHGGEPETILIFGADDRPEFGEKYGRSDTTILLRLDSEQNLISVMSIPRDLKTEIPGYETTKFNAAYSYGGPKLATQVVKEMTGLKINHIVNIDFLGFVRAVDAIGCVYTDVDRRYYHSNVGVRAGRRIFRNRHQAGLPETLRQKSAASTCATATPTPTSSARPASRASSARCATRSRRST